MRVERFVNSFFSSNTYVLWSGSDDGTCALVDCGDWEPVCEFLTEHRLVPRVVLLTHGHYDHIYGLNDMLASFPDVRVYGSEHCISELTDVKLNYSKYHEREFVFSGDAHPVSDGSRVELWPGTVALAIASPGHDSGHMAYEVDGWIFSGDAYIPGEKVVTNLRGDAAQAEITVDDIRRRISVAALTLAPGHGEIKPCVYDYYIIGARGYGRETCRAMMEAPECGRDYRIAGFLDDDPHALDGFEGYPPIVSSVEDFQPDWGQMFILALGDPGARRKYAEIARAKGCYFPPQFSHTAIIAPGAKIGQGVHVGPYCVVSPDVEIGDFTILQPFCNIGHDVTVGEFCSIESYTFLGGGVRVGDGVTLHTRSTILPHISVGAGATVGAGSVVLRKVAPGVTVFGNPARKVDF